MAKYKTKLSDSLTGNELALLAALDGLATSGASEAIRKSGATTLANVSVGGGASLPVDDTTSIVQDPVDNTKQMRIDVGNVTTGTVRVATMPDADITLTGIAATQTLTNKTINLANNTVTGTTAEFNTALSDGSFATLAGTETLTNKTLTTPVISGNVTFDEATNDLTLAVTDQASGVATVTIPDLGGTNGDMVISNATQTLTNKTVNLASNTLTGTTAQFNAALSDGSFATLAGSETLTNKTLTAPLITTNGTVDVTAAGTLAIGASMGANALTIGSTTGSVVVNRNLQINGDGTENYTFTQGSGDETLYLQGSTSATANYFAMATADGDGTDDCQFVVYGVGGPGAVTNRERMQMGYNATNTNFEIQINEGGTGSARALVLYTPTNTNQLYLGTGGSIGVGTSSIDTDAKLDVNGNIKGDTEINAQSGTTYTLAIGDRSAIVECTNASAIAVTIPTNASVAFPVGTTLVVVQGGAGAVTCTGDTGVTVNGSSGGSVATSAQYEGIAFYKKATDTWVAINK